MNHLDNKFYTPELEEFHVGFRYEGRYAKYANINFDEGKCTVGEWSEWTPTQYGNLDWNLYTERRVKYLDKKDIEELGWEYYRNIFNDTMEEYCHPNEDYKNGRTLRFPKDIKIFIEKGIDIGIGYMEFYGESYKIKNYNELKTLMKQIEIIKHG